MIRKISFLFGPRNNPVRAIGNHPAILRDWTPSQLKLTWIWHPRWFSGPFRLAHALFPVHASSTIIVFSELFFRWCPCLERSKRTLSQNLTLFCGNFFVCDRDESKISSVREASCDLEEEFWKHSVRKKNIPRLFCVEPVLWMKWINTGAIWFIKFQIVQMPHLFTVINQIWIIAETLQDQLLVWTANNPVQSIGTGSNPAILQDWTPQLKLTRIWPCDFLGHSCYFIEQRSFYFLDGGSTAPEEILLNRWWWALEK